MRLLLIEDNERLSELIAAGLAKEGFAVDTVTTVADALGAVAAVYFAAAILDLGLPDGDGLAIVQRLRDRGNATPILVLTARSTVGDRVKALHRGADDYLPKPFAFEELVARIRALLRRPANYLGAGLSLGRLTFDTGAREIVVGGAHYAITPREAAILELLLRRGNHVVPKKTLEDHLYGLSADGSANAVEVSVHRLRRQLAGIEAGVKIHTVRGVGYILKDTDRKDGACG